MARLNAQSPIRLASTQGEICKMICGLVLSGIIRVLTANHSGMPGGKANITSEMYAALAHILPAVYSEAELYL
jgi:hypothetical protein